MEGGVKETGKRQRLGVPFYRRCCAHRTAAAAAAGAGAGERRAHMLMAICVCGLDDIVNVSPKSAKKSRAVVVAVVV